jgi:hypothetical protein
MALCPSGRNRWSCDRRMRVRVPYEARRWSEAVEVNSETRGVGAGRFDVDPVAQTQVARQLDSP